MIALFDSEESHREIAHFDAFREWERAGKDPAQFPTLVDEDAPLQRLSSLFSQIFQELLIVRLTNGSWRCQSGSASYELNHLSDGEKQVLCLLGDVVILGPPNARNHC